MNLEILLSRESILVFSLIIVNILLIIFLHNKELLCLVLGIISVITYFLLSDKTKKDKRNRALILLNVVFWGVLIESFIIYKTGAITYKTHGKDLNISLWLVNCYMIFAVSIIYLNEITPIVLENK